MLMLCYINGYTVCPNKSATREFYFFRLINGSTIRVKEILTRVSKTNLR